VTILFMKLAIWLIKDRGRWSSRWW